MVKALRLMTSFAILIVSTLCLQSAENAPATSFTPDASTPNASTGAPTANEVPQVVDTIPNPTTLVPALPPITSASGTSTPGESGPKRMEPSLPPTDLLFQSIRNELSVERPLRVEPIQEADTNPRDLQTNGKSLKARKKALSGNHPWDAVDSLLIGARKLEKQAKQVSSSDPALAETLRNKSKVIRETVLEILSLPSNEMISP